MKTFVRSDQIVGQIAIKYFIQLQNAFAGHFFQHIFGALARVYHSRTVYV